MKKIFTVLLAALICLHSICALAAEVVETKNALPYTPGERTYPVEFEKVLDLSCAEVIDGVLKIKAGGSASFDVLFRLDVSFAEIAYSADEAGTLTINMEENTYAVPLSVGQATARVDVIDRQGSHVITFSSDCDVSISSVVFTKVQKFVGHKNDVIVELDDYDWALQSSVVVKEGAVAVKVNGGFRYIDYDDHTKTPKQIDGELYLPAHTSARALSIYYEEYADLDYLYFSNDNFELYAGSKGNYTIINGVKKEIGDFVVWENEEAWVPVSRLAGYIGKTVGKKDGYVIIDDRICVDNIVKNNVIFGKLILEFEKYDSKLIEIGEEYHVSQANYASDENDGKSFETPFRTIQRAAEVAKAGDTVIIHRGTYREKVTPKNDGTATSPIIFKAAPGEEVIISAFDEVSGFTHYNGRIYTADIGRNMGLDRNFVIYNNTENNEEILREGRHPNTDTSEVNKPHPFYNNNVNVMRATMGDVRIHEGNKMAQSDIDLDQTEIDYWKGGTFVGLCGEAWTLSYAKIKASEPGKIYLKDYRSPRYGITYYLKKLGSDYGYITNHINTVDMEGEWFIDGEKIYIIPPEGVLGEELKIEVKQRQRVIDLRNRKYVQFVGINTRGGGVTMAGDSEMCVLNGGTHKYISHAGYSLGMNTHTCRFYDRDNSRTNKEDAPEWGEVGFFAHGVNNAYINADISYSAAAGIYLTGLYSYIENNVVEHTSYAGTYPSGITIEGVRWDDAKAKYGGHTIVGNTSWGAGRGCLYISRNYTPDEMHVLPVIACDVGYNHFYYGSVTARDSGVIYMHGTTLGNDWMKTKIHHNVIHDYVTSVTDNVMATIVYYDGQSCVSECYSNLTYTSYDGYLSSNDSNFAMKDGTDERKTAQTDHWGNTSLWLFEEGYDAIKAEHYPYQKPFFAGAERKNERFMMNYNNYGQENTCFGENFDVSGGAFLDNDGFVRLNGENASFETEELDFYEQGNYIQLTYAMDKYKFSSENHPKVTVNINKNGENVYSVTKTVYSYSLKTDNQKTLKIYIPKMTVSGKATISVSSSVDYLRFSKVRVNSFDYEKETAKYPILSSDIIYLGLWDYFARDGELPIPTYNYNEMSNETGLVSCITKSGHSRFSYLVRDITKDTNKLSIRMASDAPSSKGLVTNIYVAEGNAENIKLDKNNATLIASINTGDEFSSCSKWSTKIITVPLNTELKKGNYNFYVENTCNKLPDLWYIAFN